MAQENIEIEKTSTGMKIFRGLEFVSFIATLIGVIAWASETDNRRQERNARAWSLIAAQASGNSGKTEALESLAKQNIPLDGIDISCERMGGGWKAEDKSCERHVLLEAPDLSGASLESANLSGTYIDEGSFVGANLQFAKFEGAVLNHTNLSGAKMGSANFSGALLAGVDFSGAVDLDKADFENAMAMANALPIGLTGVELMVCSEQAINLDIEKPLAELCPVQVMK